MRISTVFPYKEENIPQDRQLPDGMGLPVLVHYEGDPIGRVVEWQDRGDGTAEATLELDAMPFDLSFAAFGLDAQCQVSFDTDPPTVEHIGVLKAIGVWPKGSRSGDDFAH